MKKFLLSLTALSALLAGPAMAADLPVRYSPPPAMAPVVVSYYSWTGCYVGANVGGMWVKKDWSVGAGDPFFLNGASFGSHDANGWLGGVQAGCNYQVGGWVFGLQGDFDWAGASGRAPTCSTARGVGGDHWFEGQEPRLDHRPRRLCLGSLPRLREGRRRLGAGRVLVDFPRRYRSVRVTQTRSGWTVGIGGEYAFTNNLSGFIEYDYYGFGTKSAHVLHASSAVGHRRHQGEQERREGRLQL